MKNFIAFLFFAAGGIGWFFYHEYTTAEKSIAELERNLPLLEQRAALKRSEFQAYSRILEARQKVQAKQSEIEAIRSKEAALQEEVVKLRKERGEVVSRARASYAGKILPQLVLKDGRQLSQVKIIRAEDSGLSVAVPSGVQKINASDLPEDLKKSLFY